MLVHHSFDHRFVNLVERLRKQYGEEALELTGIGNKQLDVNRYSVDFFGSEATTADKTIDGNANVSDASVNAWETELKKPIMKLNALYQLWKSAERKHGIKRANKMIESEITGAIRIHDAHLWNKSYCWAASLQHLVLSGMPFYDKIKIGPVKHFDSFINLSLQYICYISNQVAGAVALPDFFIYAEYFIRKDYGEEWFKDEAILNKVNQLFQNWIYSINFSWRSNQTPFTNLSIFDRPWIESIFSNHMNPDYSPVNVDNTIRVQKIFVSEMLRNMKDNLFTFPVLTACMLYDTETDDFKDQEFFDWVSEINARSGVFNIFHDSNINALSSCCRLRNSLEDNGLYTNSFGAGGLSIGSHRVVTVNFPQISYLSERWDDFMRILESRVHLAQDILDIHRQTIQKHIENRRLPLYNYGYMDLNKQFSTIGFIGINECLEILGFDITSDEGHAKATEILTLINRLNEKRTKVDGHMRNLEQIPGESAAVTFAKKDKLMFSEINGYELYSNQYIPLVREVDVVDRVVAQGRYDKEVGGGSILHVNYDSQLTKDQMKDMIRFSAKNGVIYWAVNYGFSQCKSCGKVYVGRIDVSPCHNADTSKYLRVVGFLTNVDNWHKVRRKEFKNRQFYDISEENAA